MEDAYKGLLQKIKKGSAPEKIEAYRRLLVGYAAEDGVVEAVAKQLAIETNGSVYSQVRDLDLVSGPRLDWSLVRTERLLKCKKADERYAILSVDADYGADTRTFLRSVLQNDNDQNVRRRALETLLAKNEGSADLSLLLLAQTFLKHEDGLRSVDQSVVWDGIAKLAQSPNQIAFFDDLLATVSPEHARNVGKVLGNMYDSGVAYDQKILSLCQDAYGSDLNTDPGQGPDTDRVLYDLVENFLDHSTFAPEFMNYVFALATGPMLAFAQNSDSSGWRLLRSVRDLLGRSDEQRALATDLLYRLITDEGVFDRERGFAVPYYVRSCRAQGLSAAEIAEKLTPFLKEGGDPVSKNIRLMLNQDPDAAVERERAKQRFADKKHRIEVVKTFAGFIAPFASKRDLEMTIAPVIALAKTVEKLDGSMTLRAFIDIQLQPNEQSPVLTLDREDRTSASELIKASQHFLALPTEEDLYADEAMYNAPVHEQFELYAKHLSRFDLSLAYLDVGWDDPCAAVLSRPDAFKNFLTKELPDIACTVFD